MYYLTVIGYTNLLFFLAKHLVNKLNIIYQFSRVFCFRFSYFNQFINVSLYISTYAENLCTYVCKYVCFSNICIYISHTYINTYIYECRNTYFVYICQKIIDRLTEKNRRRGTLGIPQKLFLEYTIYTINEACFSDLLNWGKVRFLFLCVSNLTCLKY